MVNRPSEDPSPRRPQGIGGSALSDQLSDYRVRPRSQMNPQHVCALGNAGPLGTGGITGPLALNELRPCRDAGAWGGRRRRRPLATHFITAAAAATAASPRLICVARGKVNVLKRERQREKEKKRKVQLHEKQQKMFRETAQLLPVSVGALKSTAGATYSSHYPLKGIKGVDGLKGTV